MFFARQFPYFAQSVTPGSLCHGNNIAQMPTIRTPGYQCLKWLLQKFLCIFTILVNIKISDFEIETDFDSQSRVLMLEG